MAELQVECTNCSPPIPSGLYAIINIVNGNINIETRQDPDGPIPVVAAPVAYIWRIEHIKKFDYHIFSHPEENGTVPGGPAVDEHDLLFVDNNAQPEVWVICGDTVTRNDGDTGEIIREEVYIIKKKDPVPESIFKAWKLESPNPGTQVEVVPNLNSIMPGPGCLVNRVPDEFLWRIEFTLPDSV